MRWWRRLFARVVLASLTMAAGGLLAATLARDAPGSSGDEQLLDARLSRESVNAIRQDSTLHGNVASYYAGALANLLRGELGASRQLHRPVRQLLAERGAMTLRLVGAGLFAAWAVAFGLLLVTWLADSAALDIAGMVGSGALLCLPAGGIALLLMLANRPTYWALTLVIFPKTYRYLRNLVRTAEQMPHVVTARAQGNSPARVLFYHVIPVVGRELLALAGVSVGMAVGAAIPVEALSGTAGLGQLAWQAALGRDLPVLLYVSLAVITCTVLANSGADVLADERSLAA